MITNTTCLNNFVSYSHGHCARARLRVGLRVGLRSGLKAEFMARTSAPLTRTGQRAIIRSGAGKDVRERRRALKRGSLEKSSGLGSGQGSEYGSGSEQGSPVLFRSDGRGYGQRNKLYA